MGGCPATAGSVTYQFRYAPLTPEKAKAGAFAYTRLAVIIAVPKSSLTAPDADTPIRRPAPLADDPF